MATSVGPICCQVCLYAEETRLKSNSDRLTFSPTHSSSASSSLPSLSLSQHLSLSGPRSKSRLNLHSAGTKQSQSHLSMEEHHINFKETIHQRYPTLLKSIIEEGYVLPPFNHESYIYRVHAGLRNVKPSAYKPMVVSIGPYHLQNPKLQAMKKHKLWYLQSLLERINMRVETYILELEKLEDRVRKCYDDELPIDLNSEKFVEMMLLDGCFIIEFLRQKTHNPKLTGITGWMKDRIINDMMLLENQLPFFLLSKLYDMTKKDDPEEETLIALMVNSFVYRIPLPCVYAKCDYPDQEIKHLLHLVHVLFRPSPKPGNLERNAKIKIKDFVLCPVNFISKPLLKLIRWDGTQNQDDIENQGDIQSQMQSAVELQEAGVKFKKDKITAHLFDITFEDGVMKVPCFFVEDSTETFFRNLIAFEQHSMDIVPKYFTEYVDFMAQLISSKKDVKLLRNKRIIVNHLGDDLELVYLFLRLGNGVIVPYPTYYADVCKKANMHCNKPRNTMRAYLLRAHGYFDTPFATVSTIAAGVLLVLTLLQTIAAFIYK